MNSQNEMRNPLLLARNGWNDALKVANQLETEKKALEMQCRAFEVEKDMLFRRVSDMEKQERVSVTRIEQRLRQLNDVINSIVLTRNNDGTTARMSSVEVFTSTQCGNHIKSGTFVNVLNQLDVMEERMKSMLNPYKGSTKYNSADARVRSSPLSSAASLSSPRAGAQGTADISQLTNASFSQLPSNHSAQGPYNPEASPRYQLEVPVSDNLTFSNALVDGKRGQHAGTSSKDGEYSFKGSDNNITGPHLSAPVHIHGIADTSQHTSKADFLMQANSVNASSHSPNNPQTSPTFLFPTDSFGAVNNKSVFSFPNVRTEERSLQYHPVGDPLWSAASQRAASYEISGNEKISTGRSNKLKKSPANSKIKKSTSSTASNKKVPSQTNSNVPVKREKTVVPTEPDGDETMMVSKSKVKRQVNVKKRV
jgi:hypothetical protein